MSALRASGFMLSELLVAIGLAGLVGMIVLPAVFAMQKQSLAGIARTDLQERAERLLRFLGDDLRSTAFLVGAFPRRADGTPPGIVRDNAGGNPLVILERSLAAEDGALNDSLTLIKAESFFPPLSVSMAAGAGSTALRINRRPNQSPGSSREILPAPEAISHVVLASQHYCYPVASGGSQLQLLDGLAAAVPAGTELLGLRAHRYYLQPAAAGGRLRLDDYSSDEILDDGVDALQFEYLLADGRIVDSPVDAAEVRGIRVSLLVRALHPEREPVPVVSYRLGNRDYGPFGDNFLRVAVSEMIEVRNHGLP